MSSSLPSLAIIGCGAIVEKWHLRVLKKLSWTPTILVDRDEERLKGLQKRSKCPVTSTDFHALIGNVDAAIVAVPHGMHADICVPLLESGIDLLVEKPLALSVSECRRISEAARVNERIVAVGHMRRFLSGHRWVKALLDADGLGTLVSADFREGGPFSWPVASPAVWSRDSYGGGVLMDTGAHTLDLLLWWLGDISIDYYRDDNLGGVEADCEGRGSMRDGGIVRFELSRTRSLRGTAKILGEKGAIEVDLVAGTVSAEPPGLLERRFDAAEGPASKGEGFMTMYTSQLAEFLECIRARKEPTCSAADATGVVDLIQQCYRVRQPLGLPWFRPTPSGPVEVEEDAE